jgi:hypothetical protein
MGLKSTLHNLKEKYKGQKMAPAFNALHTFLLFSFQNKTKNRRNVSQKQAKR